MTTTAPRRRTRHGRIEPLPEELLHLAPESLHEPNAALAAAIAQRESARAERDEARTAITLAERADRAAAEQALEQGKSVPAATAPKAQAQLAAAERKLQAAAGIATDRAQTFLAALIDCHPAIVSAAEAELAEAAKGIEEHLAAIEEIVRQRSGAGKTPEGVGRRQGAARAAGRLHAQQSPRPRRASARAHRRCARRTAERGVTGPCKGSRPKFAEGGGGRPTSPFATRGQRGLAAKRKPAKYRHRQGGLKWPLRRPLSA